MKRAGCAGLCGLALAGLLLAGGAAPGRARAQSLEPTPTPAPTATPAAPVSQTIFHVLSFPFETMLEAIVKMSGGLVRSVYAEAEGLFAEALEPVLVSPYGLAPESLGAGAATPLFRDLVAPHWQVAFNLALLLLPATLALTAADALRQGAASTLGQLELKEALLGWLFAAGGAALSLYALGLAHRLSLAAAGAVLGADFGERVSGLALARAFFNAPALALIAALFPPAALYVGFFILFLGSTLLLALCLGLAAYTALTYLLAVIAPVVLVLGALPPLRWLPALWLKATVVVWLLPLADAFLLRAGLSLYRGFFDPSAGGSVAGFLASVVSLGGVLSVLIALNFKAAEAVFGALAEVGRQAWAATGGVLQLALSAGALAAGFVTGGALAGGLAAAAVSGGPGPNAGAPPGSAGAEPSPPPADDWRSRLAGVEERARRWLDRLGPPESAPAQAPRAAGQTEAQGQADSAEPVGVPDEPALPHTPSLAVAQVSRGEHRERGRTRTTARRARPDSQPAGQPGPSPITARSEAGRAQPGPAGEAAADPPSAEPAAVGSEMPGPEAEVARQPDAPPAPGTPTAPAAPGEAAPLSSTAPDAGLPALEVPPALEAEARLQRARLAQNFGRLLAASTRQPAGRAFGAGLQAAGLWAAYRAQQSGPAAEPAESFGPPPVPPTPPEPELAQAWRDSFERAGHTPDAGRLGELLRDTAAPARTEEARRDFAALAADPDNALSPGRFVGALSAWAEEHDLTLPDDLPARAARLFTDSLDD
jgi:hypothetical protein